MPDFLVIMNVLISIFRKRALSARHSIECEPTYAADHRQAVSDYNYLLRELHFHLNIHAGRNIQMH